MSNAKIMLAQLRPDVQKQVQPYIASIDRRLKYIAYHCLQAEIRISAKYPNTKAVLTMLVNINKNPETGKKMLQANLEAEAHLVAALQSLHTLQDIAAHFIYYGLYACRIELKTKKGKKLPPKKISAKEISDLIKDMDMAGIYSPLNSLISEGESEYLNAVVNHSKHRAIIRISTRFGQQRSFIINNFSYEEKEYEEKNAYDFLTVEYNRQRDLILEIIRAFSCVEAKSKS